MGSLGLIHKPILHPHLSAIILLPKALEVEQYSVNIVISAASLLVEIGRPRKRRVGHTMVLFGAFANKLVVRLRLWDYHGHE